MVPFEDDDQDPNASRGSRQRRRGGRRRGSHAVSDDPPVMPQHMEDDRPPVRRGGFPLGRWLLVALVFFVAYKALGVLVLLVVSLLFAHALAPVVNVLTSLRVGGRAVPRGLAAAVITLIAVTGLGVFVSTLVPVLITDLAQLLARGPVYVHTAQTFLEHYRGSRQGLSIPANWWLSLDAAISAEVGKLAGLFGRSVIGLVSQVVQLIGLVIIPILTFHLLRDGPRFSGWILSLVPSRQRLSAQAIAHDVDRALAAYVRGQTLVCVTMGVSVGVALYAIGFPYAPLLGTFAALAETVPYLGALALEVLLAVIGFSVSPAYALYGPALYFGLNQALGMTVTPHLMGSRLDLHPMAVILAVFVGGSVGGFAGMLLALPAAAIIKVLLDRWRESADRHR